MSEAVGFPEVDGIRWVPVRTAALALRVSTQRVHALIREGMLVSRVLDGTRLVSLRSVSDRVNAMARYKGGRYGHR